MRPFHKLPAAIAVGRASGASELRARREPTKRRARARVGEPEGRSPSERNRMPLMLRPTRILAFAAVAATSAVVLAGQRPPSNSAAAGEWRYYGGDSASTKYSPLGQIARANVNQLRIAWRWSSPDNQIAKGNPVARPRAIRTRRSW